ncbi:uncharacterized protein LOC111898482 [Lactuca sativa]|uniref:uncharacterized protein LOC111898482 n=1 Tax=Lactuca sativa TaxID=4236 RepID=UPI000CD7ED4F|nr:uncharacterized protein LOC111898482 [Lactuca sativa]
MTGHEYTLELLHRNRLQCVEVLRMSHDSFVRLYAHFRVHYSLKDNKHVSVEEKMAMFLMMIGHNERYVIIKRRFQNSKQTIHKFFYEVSEKMMLFVQDVMVPTSFNLNSNIPGHNRRLRRVFKGAVGALDGTLIHAVVPAKKQDLYRSRGKGDCYQNVLAIGDFNMIFTFVVAEWDGVAHDSRILSEAVADPQASFPFPPPDFRKRRALTNKEKFNHGHAKLWNFIERAFGVLKARFPILKRMAPFLFLTQRKIVMACFALHNFIRREGLSEQYFARYDEPNVSFRNNNVTFNDDEDEIPINGAAADLEYMTWLRDEIVDQLMHNID